MTTSIRTADPSDAPAIASILHAQRVFSHLADEPVDKTCQRVRDRLEASIPTHDQILVARDDDRILGYGAVRWLPNLILRGPDGYLSELFLHPDARGRGVGTALLDAFRAEARRRGADRLWCINFRERESYQRGFYRKSGWTERDIAVFTESQR